MSVLGLLGMARRAGRLVWGMDSVEAAADRAALIVTASDAGGAVLRNVAHITRKREIPVLRLPNTAVQLGHALGVALCSVAAVTDRGLAAAVFARNFAAGHQPTAPKSAPPG